MTITPDLQASLAFLRWHAPSGPWVLTSIRPDKKAIDTATFGPGDETSCLSWLQQRAGERNIYFHVNPTTRPLNIKANREDIKSLSWLHVDIDPRVGEDIDSERLRALSSLENPKGGVPRPSGIVFSGGGYQGFWRLQDPMEINGVLETAEDAKRYNIALELLFGADNCHNIDRIMRLPGTINWPDARKLKKGRVPTLAVAIELNDLSYPLSDFTPTPVAQMGGGFSASGPSTASGDISKTAVVVSGNVPRLGPNYEELDEYPVADRVKVIINQGHHPDETKTDNSRSSWLFDVVCNLHRAGVPDDLIFGIITDKDWGISASVLEKGSNAERYAIRQIERGKEEAINPVLREFNERFAIIGNIGGKCRVIEEVMDDALKRERLTRQSFDDFRNRFARRIVTIPDASSPTGTKDVPAGKWWLSHPQSRYYDWITMSPLQEPPRAYNLWRGYGVTARPGDAHQMFLDHTRENICNGNEEHYQYLIRWLARMIQRPDLAGEVAVVLRGGMGVGKSRWAVWVMELMGRHSLHISNPSHLVGNFNSHLRDCVFLFADEAFYAGDKKHESILKTLITETTSMIEAKGIDAEQQRNYIHVAMASNSQWVIPAGMDERRYFVVDCGEEHKGDHDYFTKFMGLLKTGGAENLLHYLLTLDLEGFNVRNPPQTAALMEQKLFSMSPEDEWWYNKLRDGAILSKHNEWVREVTARELHEDYLLTMKDVGLQRRSNATSMGRFLTRAVGGGYPKTYQKIMKVEILDPQHGYVRESKQRARCYEFPPLEIARANFEARFRFKGEWLAAPELDLQTPEEIPF